MEHLRTSQSTKGAQVVEEESKLADSLASRLSNLEPQIFSLSVTQNHFDMPAKGARTSTCLSLLFFAIPLPILHTVTKLAAQCSSGQNVTFLYISTPHVRLRLAKHNTNIPSLPSFYLLSTILTVSSSWWCCQERSHPV